MKKNDYTFLSYRSHCISLLEEKKKPDVAIPKTTNSSFTIEFSLTDWSKRLNVILNDFEPG